MGRLSAEHGRCALTQLGGDGVGDRPPEFPCRELRTPAGIRVFFNAAPGQVPRRMAFAVLDCTLVRLTFEPLPEHAVLAYFDSLRPIDGDDIKFKR